MSARGPRPPRLAVALDELRPGRARGSWRATWRVRNEGTSAVTIVQAWHPHARFRSRRRGLALRVAPRRSATFDIVTRSDVASTELVENAFLILQLTAATGRWRVFTRFRLTGRPDGPPLVEVEAVDAHPAEG